MRILGIETSTRIGGVAVVDAGGVVCEYSFGAVRSHAERLMEECDWALRGAGLSPSDIEGIAVSVGPGSFTGVRIGVAAARGLAYVLHIPIVGVLSLEALAFAVYDGRRRVLPMMVARDSLVYCASYDKVISKPMVLPVEEFLEGLRGESGEFIFVGDGALRHEALIRDVLGDSRAYVAGVMHSYPRAGVVAYLGLKKLESGVSDDVFTLVPAYSQKSFAASRCEGKGDRASN